MPTLHRTVRPRRRGPERVCGNPQCGKLHTNKTYCSHPCRNTAENRKKFATCREFGLKLRRGKFEAEMKRMIARCKYYGVTEDERLVLAWRYGLGASKTRRYRAKSVETATSVAAVDPHGG